MYHQLAQDGSLPVVVELFFKKIDDYCKISHCLSCSYKVMGHMKRQANCYVLILFETLVYSSD